jgi:FkbM family methyltransferase
MTFSHQFVLGLKRAIYGGRGEPYRIGRRTLRYLPGTRPVRTHYAHSRDMNARYDALQILWLLSHLSEGDIAVDVGAHCGTYSLIMAAQCGEYGHVVSFEPDPYARMTLAKNLDLNSTIKRPIIESSACSDRNGQATLFSRGGNSQSSLARSGVEFSPTHHSEAIEIKTVTLDSYLTDHHLADPQCVKIDAEGAEILILKGAQRILASRAHIVCELHPYAWAEFGSTLIELKQIAQAAGRRIRYLDQNEEIGDNAVYGTVLLER